MTDDLTPPTSADFAEDFDLNTRPAWPKVVGIISIVFACLNLSCVGCGLVGILVFIPMGEQQLGPMPDVMRPGVLAYAMMGIGLLLVGVLFIAGILTVMRRRGGWVLHVLWGLASIPLSIGNAIYQYMQQQAIADWAVANPDSQWAAQNQQGAAFQGIFLVIGILIGLAYPTFCVIWFLLIKPKHEQMTGGVEEVY